MTGEIISECPGDFSGIRRSAHVGHSTLPIKADIRGSIKVAK
jgi:hypothetical protein